VSSPRASVYVRGGAAINASSSSCDGTGGICDIKSGSLSPRCGGSSNEEGRGLRSCPGLSTIGITLLLSSVLMPFGYVT
jgi:hypothetical protein